MPGSRSFVSHLASALDGTMLPADGLTTTRADRPLLVVYDLKAIKRLVKPRDFVERQPDLWRYRELLPAVEHPVSLGEVMTPLLPCPALARHFGVERLYVKDESRLPTGSFKARGIALALSVLRERGVSRIALASAGNAAGAAAAYAARAGMECFVFVPADAPEVNRLEAALFGARVVLVDGPLDECAAAVRDGVEREGWFDLGTLREPYRLEGKKTMGLELAEQLGWRLPEVILYPTGGGTGLLGIWKAFQELAALGWLETRHAPRLFACQSTGCAPVVQAFDAGRRFAEQWPDADTRAAGLRVPRVSGDFMIIDALRATDGRAMAAAEERLGEWMHLACKLEGISLCPEAAVCLGVLERALAEGLIRPESPIVIFNTAAAQKYVELMRGALPRLTSG